jgi:predicted YcjX-like family ATPase
MIGEPFVRANARQSGLIAVASVRATAQIMRNWQGLLLEVLRGIPVGRSEPIEVRPGEIPGQVPDRDNWGDFNFNIREFAPPQVASAQNQPLPHINLDKVLQFLIA